MIEVILREDVKSLGKAGALVRVKPGYARNFLLPRGLAYEASEGNKKRIAAETKARAVQLASGKGAAVAAAAGLSAVALTFGRRPVKATACSGRSRPRTSPTSWRPWANPWTSGGSSSSTRSRRSALIPSRSAFTPR